MLPDQFVLVNSLFFSCSVCVFFVFFLIVFASNRSQEDRSCVPCFGAVPGVNGILAEVINKNNSNRLIILTIMIVLNINTNNSIEVINEIIIIVTIIIIILLIIVPRTILISVVIVLVVISILLYGLIFY